MDINQLFEALEQNPTQLDTLDTLQVLLLADGDQEGLERAYTIVVSAMDNPRDVENVLRRIEVKTKGVQDPDLLAWINFYLGMMYHHRSENPAKGEMYLRKVPCVEPYREALVEYYTRFYAEKNNWKRLETYLEESGLYGSGDESALIIRRTLAQQAEQFKQPDKAVAYWAAVHQLDPDDQEAESRLKELYVAVQKWHSLIDLLKAQHDRLPEDDKSGRIAILLEMVAIFRDHIKSETKVTGAYQAILDIDPANEMALNALTEQFEAMKRYPDLVKVLQKKIEATSDTAQILGLHRQIAKIMLEKFSNSAEAIKSYEAILVLDPTDREALAVLKDVYEKRNDWEHFVEVSEREVGLLEDANVRHQGYLQLARLAAEKIRKPQVAISLWRNVLEFDGQNVQALDHLEQLFEREKDYVALVDILERKLTISEDKTKQIEILDKLGLIYGVRIADADRTVATWKRVLEIDPAHRKAQTELRKRFLEQRQWDELEWFFRNYGEVTEFVRTLEAQVKTLEDPADQIAILYKTAKIWREELDQTPRAVRSLERVLELDAEHVQTAEILIPIYRELEEWAKLPNVYHITLNHTEDPVERQVLFLELAELQEEKLQDIESAFFCYVEAFKEDWHNIDIYEHLERLAALSENWDSYVLVLEETIERVDLPEYRVRYLLRLAQLYVEQVGDHEKALAYYLQVLEVEPDSRAAIVAIESLYKQMGRWQELIGICQRKLDIEPAAEQRKEILFELGAIWRDHMENPEEAVRVYRSMLVEFPAEVRIYDEVSMLYLNQGEYDALRDVLERKLNLLQEQNAAADVIAEHMCYMGMLTYGTEGNIRSTLAWYEMALGFDPDNERAVRLLEELLADEENRPHISAILQPVYERRQDWSRLADVFEIRLRQMEVDEVGPSERVTLLKSLGNLYGDLLQNDALAFRTYSRVFQFDPLDEEVRPYLELLAERLDQWVSLVLLYEEKVSEISEIRVRQEVLLTIAQLYHTRLESADDAQRFYQQVLDIDPLHRPSLDALEEIFRATQQYEQLLAILERKCELATDKAQRIYYHFEVSKVYCEYLDDCDKAIAAALQIIEIDPLHSEALEHLDMLYQENNRWSELAGVLSRRIEQAVDNVEIVQLKSRLAAIQENRVDDVSAAIATYASIIELDPDHLDAVQALERLFENPDYSGIIAPILEPYYLHRGDWERLVRVYMVEEEQAEDPVEKVLLLFQVSELYEKQGMDPRSAFEHYGRAYHLLPENEETLDALLRLADVLANHDELVLLLEEKVEDVADLARKKEIHRVCAQLFRDQCDDPAGAKRHFAAVLEIEPDDLAALNALTELHRAHAEWQPLVNLLLAKANLETDAAAKRALLLEAGDLCALQLQDADKAIGIYETVLQFQPGDDASLKALEQLYELVENWDQLVWVYGERISRTDDIEERKQYARAKARTQEEKQGRVDDAIETHNRTREWDPSDLDALEQLDRLYTRSEDWQNLLSTLQRQMELVDADQRQQLQLRIGKLFEEKLEDIWQAIDAYQRILTVNPLDEGALESLESIVRTRDERERAFEVLRPVLAELQDWEKLIALYAVNAEHQVDLFEKVRIYCTMGEIAEIQLHNAERAFDFYGQAFHLDVERAETIQQLERLAVTFSLWTRLADLYGAGAADAAEPEVQLRLRLKQGMILKDQLRDFEGAVAHFKAMFEDYADNRAVLEALDQLYEMHQDWHSLLDIMTREIDAVDAPAEKIDLYFRLARVAETQLSDRTRSYEANREVLFLEPQNPTAIRNLENLFLDGHHRLEISDLLEPIYRQREDWNSLLGMFELKLDVVEDVLDQLELIKQIANINLEVLGRQAEAIVWYGRAFALDPEDDGLLARLEGLVAATGQWSEFVNILSQAIDQIDDAERKILLWNKAGRVLEEQLHEPERAEAIYLQVLAADDENWGALQRLDAIYSHLERWEELEGILQREIEFAPYDDDKVALLMRLAELRRDRLSRWDDAVSAFRSVLELMESHREALLALAEIYATRNDAEPLFEVYGRLADVSQNDEERAGYFKKQATIAELHLEIPEKAIELWEEILILRASDTEAIRELQRLRHLIQDWSGLIEAYERELIMVSDDPLRSVELFKQMGRAWRDQLQDGLQSQESWRRVLDMFPDDREALDSLRSLYRESENHESLVDILERMTRVTSYDLFEQIEIWQELGVLKTEILMLPQQAIHAWQQVLALDPNHRQAILALEKLYFDEAQWPACVDILKRRVGLEEAVEDQIESLMKAARIQLENLGDADAAALSYEAVLERHPAYMDAYYSLEKIYESKGDWYRLAEVLDQKVSYLDDELDQVFTLQTLARIYEERLTLADRAFNMLDRALTINPTEEQTLREIERVATSAQFWEPLFLIYERVVPKLQEDDQIVEYQLKAARLLRDRLNRPVDAIERFNAVLQRDATNEEALRSLAALYEQNQLWDPMIDIMERLVEVVMDYADRVRFQTKIGATLESQMQAPEEAIEAYRKVLEIEETDLNALLCLERLYRQQGEAAPLVDILERIATLQPERETELKLRIGELYETKLGRDQDAIVIYQELLTANPNNREALDRLMGLLFENNDIDRLVDLFESRLNVVQEGPDRVELHKQLATLYADFKGAREQAAYHYQQLLSLAPGNLDALQNLEKLYELEERWEDLLEVLERHVQYESAAEGKANLLLRAAQIYQTKLVDVDNAIRTYERVTAQQPGHPVALNALEDLYRQTEQWERVAETLDHKLAVTQDVNLAVQLRHLKGQLLLQQIGSPERAAVEFRQAFTLDPNYLPAAHDLVKALGAIGSWPEQVKILAEIVKRAGHEKEKAQAYCDMGNVYHRRLKDLEGAIDGYERALEIIPDFASAVESLAQLYIEEQQWARALPLLDIQRTHVDVQAQPEAAADLFRKTAMVAEKMLDEDRALLVYEEADRIQPNDMSTLRGLAHLYYRAGDYSRARQRYQQMIDVAEASMASEELVDIYMRLGDVCLKLGAGEEASEFLEKVLLYQPNNPKAIGDLVKFMEQHGDWEGAIRYMRELKGIKDDPLERLAIQIEIGDVYKDKLDDIDGAVSTYREALTIRPDSLAAHIKLLEIFIATKRFEEAIDTLNRLMEISSDNTQKANYCFTIAIIYKDQIQDGDKAIEFLNKTLDLNPDRIEAFKFIDEMLTKGKDWKNQAKNYTRMIQRIRGQNKRDLEFMLYKNLGEIYRSRIRNIEYAIPAYQLASQLHPDDVPVHEILAELYTSQSEHVKAADEHRQLLRFQPDRVESYRALKDIYLDTRQYDRAWCITGVLVMLGQADESERQFFHQHRAPSIKVAKRSLDLSLWRDHVFTEDLEYLVGQVFQIMYQAVGDRLGAKEFKDLGIKKRDEINLLKQKDLMFVNVLKSVARVLGIAPPRVFLSDRAVGARIEGTIPPTLIIGPDMLQGKTEAEMAFTLGKFLTYFHPMHLLAGVYPVVLLKTLLICAQKFCSPNEMIPGESPEVERVIREMQRNMAQQLQMQLANTMEQFRRARKDVDLAVWLQQVELTADRAGFLCCGDLEVAGRLLRTETAAFSTLAGREKVKDLVLYSISERFFNLRTLLGLTVGQ